jgi:fructokinase
MIIVIGEALIDLIQDRYNPTSYNAVVGGANANVAIALARRGTNHTFLARISTDSFGQQITKKLNDNNVNTEHKITTTEPTTLAVVSIGPNGSPSYSFYVNGTADWGWTNKELPNLEAEAIQFGCLTMAMEPGNLIIEEWAKAQSHNKTISHDINMRPALGFDQATELTRVKRVNDFSHIIKASDEDLEWLDPTRTPDETAKEWSKNKLVLITKGSEGVDVYRNQEFLFNVPSRKINVVDTVGAGDTFTANLLGQLQENNHLGENPTDKLMNIKDEDLHTYVHIAGIAASINCERAGAEPPTKADLDSAIELIW